MHWFAQLLYRQRFSVSVLLGRLAFLKESLDRHATYSQYVQIVSNSSPLQLSCASQAKPSSEASLRPAGRGFRDSQQPTHQPSQPSQASQPSPPRPTLLCMNHETQCIVERRVREFVGVFNRRQLGSSSYPPGVANTLRSESVNHNNGLDVLKRKLLNTNSGGSSAQRCLEAARLPYALGGGFSAKATQRSRKYIIVGAPGKGS